MGRRCSIRRAIAVAALSALSGQSASAQLRAFGEAEGFASLATGARSAPTVYHVTNLGDSGAGSFRDAVSASNRIVVFDVGGNINILSKVGVQDNVTIAGQTAPGGGIQITGHEVSFANASNCIARYIRVRPGDSSPSTDNGISLYRGNNIILDHVSVEFANWNNIDAVDDNHTGSQFTIQNSLIADPINQQFVAHTESLDGAFTWSNNLLVSAHNRMPLAKVDTIFKDNVIYNYGAAYTVGDTSGVFNHDLINNYFITGPANPTGSNTFYQMNTNQSIYSLGNLRDTNVDGVLNGSSVSPGGVVVLNSPWSPLTTTLPTLSAAAAYAFVDAHAGASITRDELDNLVVSQLETLGNGPTGYTAGTAGPDGGMYHHAYNTGLTNGGLGSIASVSRAAGFDTDNDGVPDTWETAHGMNPNSANDAVALNPVGYLMVEQYINELGSTDDTLTSSSNGSWTASSNWAGGVVPGPMDYAEVRGTGSGNANLTLSSGAANVMTVSIGGNGPAAGEALTVSGGTFSVYDTVTVGDQNNATLNVSSGTLQAWNIILGNTVYSPAATNYTGTLNLSGGTLALSQLVLGAGTPGSWTTGGSMNWTGGTLKAIGILRVNVPISVSSTGGTINSNGYNGTISSLVSGTGGLTKTGTGTVTLTGTNTYTGPTTINAGTIAVSTLTVAGAAGPLGAAATSAGNLVLSGGTLQYFGTGSSSTDRLFTLGSAGGTLDSGASGQMRFTNTGAITASGTGNRTLFLTGTSSLNDLYPSIGDPSSGKTTLDKEGAGRWILNGSASPRTYSGDTIINAGTLMTNADDPFPYGGGKGNLVINAGTFELNGHSANINGLSGAGTLNQRGNNTRTLTMGNGNASATFSGVISNVPSGGTALLNVVKTGSGTQALSGANTYSGTTTIGGGTLVASTASAIPSGAGKGNVTVNGSGIFDMAGISQPINGLDGNGVVTSGANTPTLTIGNGDANGNFSGTIRNTAGTLAVTKTGAGTQTLAGTNSYSGMTTVNAGKLVMSAVRSSGIAANGGTLAVIAGGSAGGVSYVKSVSINEAAGAKLDLNDNDLVVDYTGASPWSTIYKYVQDGFGSTMGITSTVRDSSGSATQLVTFDNADTAGAYTEWPIGSGHSIDSTTVIGKYTYFGDLNLDGAVTGDDLSTANAMLGHNLTADGVPPSLWWQFGDVSPDGVITGDDLSVVAAMLGSGVSAPLSGSVNAVSVPEPLGAELLAVGVGVFAARRRRSLAPVRQ